MIIEGYQDMITVYYADGRVVEGLSRLEGGQDPTPTVYAGFEIWYWLQF